MEFVTLGLVLLAVIFALFRALGMNGIRVDFGWLAVLCLIVAYAFIPAVSELARQRTP